MSLALGIIAAVLAAIGLYYARQQLRALAALPDERDRLSALDYRYHRHLAWRRLLSSVLMLVMSGMLAASLAYDLEAEADRVTAEAKARNAAHPGEPIPPDDPGRQFLRLYVYFWLTFLSLLGVVVFLVAIDVWAIRRYSMRHLRQISEDRNAMLRGELAKIREEKRRRESGE